MIINLIFRFKFGVKQGGYNLNNLNIENRSAGNGNSSIEQNPIHIYEQGGTYVVALAVTDNVGATASWEGDVEIIDTGLEEQEIPDAFKLAQNYPNPFKPSTTISYSLPELAEVTIKVYNIHGQLVSTLVNGTKSAGQHNVQFNASSQASG